MLNLDFKITDTSFDISFQRVSRPILSWREEVSNTAKHIRNSTDREIFVATSGGIDAEVTCRGFLDAGIPFRMFIVEYANGKNSHDVGMAYDFATKYNIRTFVHVLDMEQFLSHGMYKYVEQGYKSTYPYRYFQIYLLEEIEKLNCCGVVGSGDLLFLSDDTKINLYYDREYFLAAEWCKNNKVLHYPALHSTTPELTASYLNHPVMKFIASDHNYAQRKKDSWHSDVIDFCPEKIITYHSSYPEMTRRKKFHGWEQSMDVLIAASIKLRTMFPNLPFVEISLDDVKNQLGI